MDYKTVFKNVFTTADAESRILFSAEDVTASLGYQSLNDALDYARLETVTKVYSNKDAIEREVGCLMLNESDFYRLVVHSPNYTPSIFEKWVFESVLPALINTGTYNMTDEENDFVFKKLLPEVMTFRAEPEAETLG